MTRLRDSSGFSLVEVLIAALILVVGSGAAFSLIDSANRAVSFNSARVGSTNLARELSEFARTTDYDLLQPTQIVAALRAHPTIAGTLSGSTWTIERRNVTYTVTTNVCTYDDPKDGSGPRRPTTRAPRPRSSPAHRPEVNPDDFRRVTHTLSWTARGRTGSSTQSALVVNPSGGLGPRITEFGEPTTQITANSISWGAAQPLPFKLKSTTASSVHWTVDVSGGDAAGGPTDGASTGASARRSARPRRGCATAVHAPGVAFDSRGIPGEARIITVHVNRHAPNPVTGLEAGYNTAHNVVDMRWDRYDERDLQGYRVVRESDNTQICPAAAGAVQQGRSCTDKNPPDAGSKYKVFAVDCLNLKAPTCVHRDGDPAARRSRSPRPPAAAAPTAPYQPDRLGRRRQAHAVLDRAGHGAGRPDPLLPHLPRHRHDRCRPLRRDRQQRPRPTSTPTPAHDRAHLLGHRGRPELQRVPGLGARPFPART